MRTSLETSSPSKQQEYAMTDSMTDSMPSETKINTFVDAGSAPLSDYVFVAEELNKRRASPRPLRAAPDQPDSEAPVKFRLNQTGNIFYSTSSDALTKETKDLFDSVTVLFSAMTAALSKKGKDLFDYDAWSNVIRQSGFFIEVQKFEKVMTISDNSVTVDTQVVQQLLPGLTSGSSMEIAKSVLSALSGKYSVATFKDDSKFSHLLFICEELFGAPSVTVRLFFGTKKTHSVVTSSPCHKSSSKTFEQSQQADTFLFVDPKTIAKFAGQFATSTPEYEKLIAKLQSFIK
jgi:hypothetical protein